MNIIGQIDVDTFLKMFNDGIYYCDAVDSISYEPVHFTKLLPIKIDKINDCIMAMSRDDLEIDIYTCRITRQVYCLPLKNYKKRGFLGWALTKEELL